MKNLTWDSFTKKIHINAPIEKLYWCWATEEGICSWFLRSAIYERNKKQLSKTEFLRKDDA